jgi:PAS domain S-box-containing protein
MIEKSGAKHGCRVSGSRIENLTAEEQVRLLSCALSSLKSAVYITDLDHNIIYVNQAIEDAQGYRPEEVLGKKAYDFFERVPGNPPDLADLIAREARDGFWIGEIYNRRKDGTVFPVQLIENTIYGKDGEVIGYIGISCDISEKYEARVRLAESEEKYRLLTENSLTGIYIASTAGKILYLNKRLEEISGYSADELLGTDIFQLLHTDDRERVKEMSARRIREDAVSEYFICRALRKDGSIGWFEIRSSRIMYNGQPALLGNFIEITEQKRMNDALRESEERLRTLIDATPDIICFKDGDGRWLVANDAIVKNFGLERVNYRGKTDRELAGESSFYHDAFLFWEASNEKAWQSGALSRGEEIIPCRDHPDRIYDVIKVPIFNPDGSRKGLVVLGRDITEHKRSEERLREASKLEAVGIMSLGIAHEFNNILMGISGYAQLAQFDVGDRVLVKKATSTILRLTGRARTMIRRLSTFGRREKLQPKPVDLTRIIDEAIALQERELKLSNIRIRRVYKDPALVMADFSQIEQVFVNLIMNACHAMVPEGKGTLTVQVENVDGKVEARVADTGIGIPEDTIPRIFQPFFTARKEGKRDWVPSLGLGLWVSRQIMEEHGGTISVDSGSGSGTTFILTLPRAIGSVREEIARDDLAIQLDSLKGKEILIIDDEEDLLIIFKKYLTGKGMKVTTARNGREALALCRERRYDIILMDYIMPGLSGLRLARRIRELTPESRIVVITGKRIPEESVQELESHIAGLLHKPLDLKRLGETLSGIS